MEEKKLNDLIIEIEKTNYMSVDQTRDLFNFNNLIFPDIKEFGTGCSSCRARVFNRLKTYWENNIKEKYI